MNHNRASPGCQAFLRPCGNADVMQADIGIVLGLDSRLRQVLRSAGVQIRMLVAGETDDHPDPLLTHADARHAPSWCTSYPKRTAHMIVRRSISSRLHVLRRAVSASVRSHCRCRVLTSAHFFRAAPLTASGTGAGVLYEARSWYEVEAWLFGLSTQVLKLTRTPALHMHMPLAVHRRSLHARPQQGWHQLVKSISCRLACPLHRAKLAAWRSALAIICLSLSGIDLLPVPQPRRRAAPLKLSNARNIDPTEIDLCKREDGSEYLLGAGSFGEVCPSKTHVPLPYATAAAAIYLCCMQRMCDKAVRDVAPYVLT